MAKLYESSSLSSSLLAAGEVSAAARAWTADAEARGKPLGAWHVDTGVLGRIFMLRGSESTCDRLEMDTRLCVKGLSKDRGLHE